MDTKQDGGTAFPVPSGGAVHDGMSLRDWFAASESLADCEEMSVRSCGKLIGREPPNFDADPIGYMEWDAAWRAKVRYIRADAMLGEREK